MEGQFLPSTVRRILSGVHLFPMSSNTISTSDHYYKERKVPITGSENSIIQLAGIPPGRCNSYS